MTRKHLREYLRLLADKMHLRDYVFEVLDEEPDPDAWADMRVVENTQRVIVRFSSELLRSGNAERIRLYAVHELVHVFMEGIENVVHAASPNFSAATFDLLARAHRNAEELATDRLACLIAEFMPLPKVYRRG